MGAGLVAKAALGHRISIVSFGLAQVLIDIEPGVRMIRDDDVLHGISHTLWGAIVVGVVAALLAPWLIRMIVGRYNTEVAHYGFTRWIYPESVSAPAVWLGAFLGTFSHLVLDGLMHADMAPFAPLMSANPLLDVVAHDDVYGIMTVCAAVGATLWMIRWWLSVRAQQPRPD